MLIKLKSYDAEHVWKQQIVNIILILCPFSDSCMSLSYSYGRVMWKCWI